MTVTEALQMIEGYYGAYSRPLVRQLVAQELERYSDTAREMLVRELLRSYSTRYGTVPDVAAIVAVEREHKIRIAAAPAHKALPESEVPPAERAEVARGLRGLLTTLQQRKSVHGVRRAEQ